MHKEIAPLIVNLKSLFFYRVSIQPYRTHCINVCFHTLDQMPHFELNDLTLSRIIRKNILSHPINSHCLIRSLIADKYWLQLVTTSITKFLYYYICELKLLKGQFSYFRTANFNCDWIQTELRIDIIVWQPCNFILKEYH